MSNPLASPLPQRFVQSPPEILYDLTLPPEIRDTYLQLLGLAWNSEKEPPEIVMEWTKLEDLTGKRRSTMYGHLSYLRDRSKLRFESAGKGNLRVTFLVYVSRKSYAIPDGSPPIESIDSSLVRNKIEEESSSARAINNQEDTLWNSREKLRNSRQERARPNKKAPAVPREILAPIVNALESVTGMDKNLNYPRMAKEARDLHLAGYSAAQILQVYGPKGAWWKDDWRGRDKKERPQIGVIRQTIKTLLNGSAPPAPHVLTLEERAAQTGEDLEKLKKAQVKF